MTDNELSDMLDEKKCTHHSGLTAVQVLMKLRVVSTNSLYMTHSLSTELSQFVATEHTLERKLTGLCPIHKRDASRQAGQVCVSRQFKYKCGCHVPGYP